MIVTIEGNRSCSKTTQAYKLIGCNNFIVLNGYEIDSPWFLKNVNKHIDYILIDECNKKQYNKAFEFFNKKRITIKSPYGDEATFNTPIVILIKQSLD